MKGLKSIFLVAISVAFTVMVSCQCMAITNPATTATPLADDLDINQYSLLNVKKIMDIRNAAEFSSIQAAIDDLPVTGGMVIIPSGTYNISTQIEILKNNVMLIGEGWSTELKLTGNENNVISIGAHKVGNNEEVTPVTGVIVKDLKINGNKANISGPNDAFCNGIRLNSASRCRLSNLWVHDCLYDGISVYNNSNENVITSCHSQGNGLSGIFMEFGIVGCVVDSNNFANNLYGVWINGKGADTRNDVISNNIVMGNTYGIRIEEQTSYITVTGNNIANNTDGIHLSVMASPTLNSEYHTISGNTLRNNSYGIAAYGASGNSLKSPLIADNTIKASSIDAILMNTVVGANITNNLIEGQPVNAGGIRIYESSKCVISGNKVTDTTGYGINITSIISKYNNVIGNIIYENRGGALNDAGEFTYARDNRFTTDRLAGAWQMAAGASSVIVGTAEVQTGDYLILTITSSTGSEKPVKATDVVNGTSFTVKTLDHSTVSQQMNGTWQIVH